MKTQLQDTGERMIPEYHKGKNIYGAHIGRYQAGALLLKDKVVLDVACGTGYGTKLMSAYAKEVIGVDIDQDTILYAQENYSGSNITYKLGDGIALPIEDKSVDVVVSYETIEHIENYEQFLKEVKRVLKPNGLFLLSTPNDIEYAEGNHFHIHEFTYEELKSLVQKYFKFHKDYFQTLWLYSSILPKSLQTKEWEEPILTMSTIPLKPEQSIYFFLLCSDVKITSEIKPSGVIGEHFRQRDLQAQNEKRQALRATIQKHMANEERLKIQVKELTSEKETLQQKIYSFKRSPAWRVALILMKCVRGIKHPIRSFRKITKL